MSDSEEPSSTATIGNGSISDLPDSELCVQEDTVSSSIPQTQEEHQVTDMPSQKEEIVAEKKNVQDTVETTSMNKGEAVEPHSKKSAPSTEAKTVDVKKQMESQGGNVY